MQSEHEIWTSKTGSDAEVVMKDRTIIELYDSGSESDYPYECGSESEYDIDSTSDADEHNREVSHLGSTSEPSTHEFFHNNSKTDTKLGASDDVISNKIVSPKTRDNKLGLCPSDLISSLTSLHSDITDDFILPVAALTQSPAVQMMDRNGGNEFFATPPLRLDNFGTPPSSLDSGRSSPTGSESSGESLFSIPRNSSFTKRNFTGGTILESGEFCDLKEVRRSDMERDNVPIIQQENVEPRVEVCDRVSPSPYCQKEFVLPLNFPKAREIKPKNNNNNNNNKKKKREDAGPFCQCGKCPNCKFPTCSCKCCSWTSCFSCCKLPSCNCTCNCASWTCCCTCPTSSCCTCSFLSLPSWACCCKTKSHV